MASKSTIVLVILAIVLLGAGGYLFLNGGAPSATALSGGLAPEDPGQAAFIQLASQLGPITLDASVLDDPRFTNLVDLGTQIVPESAGRPDPFAPIGAR
jgi:hypothetical protein